MSNTDGWTNLHDNSTPEDYRGYIVLPSKGAGNQSGGGGGVGVDGLNIPSKPTTNQQLGPNTQAGRRWQENVFDIHRTSPSGRFPQGRPWNGPMELSANPDLKQPPGFVGALQQGMYVADDNDQVDRRATFASVWSAPWVPLEKYFVFNYRRKQLSFAYQRMKTDEQNAMDKYYEAAAKMASGMNLTVGFEYGEMPPFVITGTLGSPITYIRNIKLAEAAMAGDPWLLGFQDEPNAELAKLLGYNERTGMRQLSYKPEPKPVVTPEQVLATAPQDINAMIADAVAKALAAERAANAAKGEQMRAGKKNKAKKIDASSAPAGDAAA